MYIYTYSIWLQEQLIKQELLGSGRYGEVYQFNYENNLYAGKIIHKNLLPGHPHLSADQVNKFIIKIGHALALFDIIQHPNIEIFHSEILITPDSPPILLTELLHENLSTYTSRMRDNLTNQDQINLCHDMAKGLQFLHNHEVVHSNLHGANILITKDGQAKIGDYICPQIDSLHEITASIYKVYMSPESISSSKVISKQSDIYSFGVLCLHVTTQNPPLPEDIFEVSEVQSSKKQMDQINKNLLLPLIAKCFKSPIARPHIDNVCTKLAAIKEGPQVAVSSNPYQTMVCMYCKYINYLLSHHNYYLHLCKLCCISV